MKQNLIKRIEALEQVKAVDELPVIEVILISEREQVDYPERFKRVLVDDSDRKKIYEYVRL